MYWNYILQEIRANGKCITKEKPCQYSKEEIIANWVEMKMKWKDRSKVKLANADIEQTIK